MTSVAYVRDPDAGSPERHLCVACWSHPDTIDADRGGHHEATDDELVETACDAECAICGELVGGQRHLRPYMRRAAGESGCDACGYEHDRDAP